MKTEISREESFVNLLVLHSLDNQGDIGLLTGQTGMMIVLARYARLKGQEAIDAVADALFDRIVRRAARSSDIGFGTGLSGICWGVEYLVQQGLLEGPADDICKEADARIARTDIGCVDDMSLETGLAGLWLNVWARIQGNMRAGLPLPFTTAYLQKWHKKLSESPDVFDAGAAERLGAAIDGRLTVAELSLRPFIDDKESLMVNNMSLKSGVAGYVELEYLEETK